MATPTCIKCGGTQFESKEMSPKRSKSRLCLLQCAACGGVVGVVDLALGDEVHEIRKALERLAADLF